jgi:hypothetical protein
MESAAQTCARLIAALEDLAGQEAAALQTRDFATAIEIQDRAAPLVAHLAAHARDLTDPAQQARLRAVQEKRDRTGEWLAEQIERARAELARTSAARRRVAQIAPVYGRSPAGAASGHLSAVG